MSDQGTRHNKGKLRWRNFPMFLFKPIIEVGQFGEEKYDTFNFLKCFPVNDTLDSLKRHLEQFENPYVSDLDEESLKSHMAHVAWNALVILQTLEKHPEMDDRYKVDKSNLDKAKLRELNKIQQDLNSTMSRISGIQDFSYSLDKNTFLDFSKDTGIRDTRLNPKKDEK